MFYDLGNAYFRDGNIGRAILNYERAWQIDRHHPETEANLRMARDQTRALELTPSSLEKYLSAAGLTAFIIAAAVLFWVAVILSIVRRVGVAGQRAHDDADDRELAAVVRELARRERWRRRAAEGRVEQEDGEHTRDREGDDEPRRTARRHARRLARRLGVGFDRQLAAGHSIAVIGTK